MSGCWASSPRAQGFALLLAALLLAGESAARVVVNGVVLDDSGRVRRSSVHVSRHGAVVTSGADVVIGDDTLGHGPLVIDEGNGMVRVLSDARVRAGDHFDGDVVAIFGNVTVEGQVTGSAVAVFGHLEIAPGASVGGDAVAVFGRQRCAGQVTGSAVAVIGSLELMPGAAVGEDAVAVGGRVNDADGSRIAGQSVSVGLLPLTLGLPGLPSVLGLIVLGWLVTVFFGWLFALMFPERLARVGLAASRHTFLSIVLAAASLLAWPVAAILIMATIIGLPVGLVLLFAYPLVVYAGQLAGTYVLGSKLLHRRLGDRGALGPIVAGSLLIAVLFATSAACFSVGGAGGAWALFFGLVGMLILLGLTTIGTGAFLISRAGTRPQPPLGPPASA